MSKIRVGILGATGTVGQRFLAMLDRHPQFVVTALAASDRSQGRPYGAACSWRLAGDMPSAVRSLVVQPTRPPLDCDVVFSSLPADVAGEIETAVEPAGFAVSAQCHRVNVVDGHLAAVRVQLSRPAEPAELREAFAGFAALPQQLRLHTAPAHPILVRDEPDRPQPRLDRDAGGGMSVTVGRIAPDRVLGHRFVVLSHNTIRGAAGAAILNAE